MWPPTRPSPPRSAKTWTRRQSHRSTSTFTLTGPSGAVPATVTYDSASKTATLTPASGTGLAFNTAYTVTISGAQDVSHKTINTVTWPFTTGNTVTSTSIWKSPPSSPDESPAPDGNGVELGVKFRSSVAGTITGIRFFKGDGSTGTHVGHLWSSTGTSLATVTFTNETAQGWQTANFSSPVTISPNTTYVASYYAPSGNYAATTSYFTGSGVNSWPLQALADGQDGSNGLYLYGSDSFPTNSYIGSNYWVDVVFSSSSTTTATTTSLASSLNPSVFGQSVTFTATVVKSSGAGTPTGTVTFQDGSATLGTGTLNASGVATLTVPSTSPLIPALAAGRTRSRPPTPATPTSLPAPRPP